MVVRPALVPQRVPELPPLELARPLAPVNTLSVDVLPQRFFVAKPLEALLAVDRRAAGPHEARVRVAADAHHRPAAVPQAVPELPESRPARNDAVAILSLVIYEAHRLSDDHEDDVEATWSHEDAIDAIDAGHVKFKFIFCSESCRPVGSASVS